MKKYLSSVIIIAYTISPSLPHVSGISIETCQLTTISGIPFLENHWLVTSTLIVLLLIYQWRGKQSLVAGNVLLVLIGVILPYLYLISSIGVFGESSMVGFRLIRDTLATSLVTGYYLSALFALMGYFRLIKKRCK